MQKNQYRMYILDLMEKPSELREYVTINFELV